MKPVVLLSHSSKDNARAIALQQALAATGSLDTAFDVQNLQHGEAYRPQLYRWMARCHGAVLLITEQVMAEPHWVLQEATVLRARSLWEGPAFRLFLLIDAAVGSHDVWKTRFAPLGLDELQQARLAAPTDPIDAFVAQVQAGMQDVAAFGNDHQGRLAELIFDHLTPFMAERTGERVLSECLQVDDALWHGIVPTENALQVLLARRLASGDLAAYGGLERLFSRLQQNADMLQRKKLLNVLSSHWVPLANASRLADAIDRLHPPAEGEAAANVVVLQTEFTAADKVAELHDRRRFQPYQQLGAWVSVELGNETATALTEKVRRALQARLFPMEPAIGIDDIVDELADGQADGEHCFVHVAGVESLQHLLPVARRFWACLFVLTARSPACLRLAEELAASPIAPPHPEEVRRMRDFGKALGHAGVQP